MPLAVLVDRTEDDALVAEKQVALDLGKGSVCNLHLAGVARAWPGPLSADLAGLAEASSALLPRLRNVPASFIWFGEMRATSGRASSPSLAATAAAKEEDGWNPSARPSS